MRHPSERQLALLSGGDLAWWKRWRVEGHVERCAECRRGVEAFRAASSEARGLAELPSDFDWNSLAVDMQANIRLGLAAGECVEEPAQRRGHWGWNPALALAGVTLMIVSGWMLWVPQPRGSQDVLLQATSAGIELNENGRVLTVLHRATEPALLSADGGGSVRARYVDADTGQVTITNVYTE